MYTRLYRDSATDAGRIPSNCVHCRLTPISENNVLNTTKVGNPSEGIYG